MSVCFLFVFIGIADLAPETLLIGCAGTVVQCLWKSKQRPKAFQVVFSIANTGIAVTLAYSFYHWPVLHRFEHIGPLLLIATGLAYYVLNTVPIAEAISLSEGKRFGETWHNCYFWSFPFYLVGASVAWIISLFTKQMHWQGSIVLLPVIYLIYRSYQLYLARLEDERRHVESIAGLHLRTIEALALAIEAKDHTTHEHLRRVRVYAVEVGKEMGLSEAGTGGPEGGGAAARYRQAGGAGAHHLQAGPADSGRIREDEDPPGGGRGDSGASLVSVSGGSDCEGASREVGWQRLPVRLARRRDTHRGAHSVGGRLPGRAGFRPPIPARPESGRGHERSGGAGRQELRPEGGADPEAALCGTGADGAGHARQTTAKLSTDVRIEKGAEPAAGYQGAAPHTAPGNEYDFLCSIAAARQEVQLLFELVQDLGNSLSLDETLSVVAARLKKIVPYDAIAIYVRLDRKLIPQYVNGEDFRLFSSLEIPVGEGLSGWVAENRKPILNGNPSVEPGYLADPAKFSTLRSALAVPLEGLSGAIGVMTLYRAEHDAFSRDHLRILLAISSKVSLAVENALIFRQVEDSATTDYLSGLPNARSLFLRLDSEVARCRRSGEPLCVVVCDLDGFKQINDRFGHLEGNKVLRLVSEALRSRCREYDYVARMGGDEFVLLLPGSDRRSIQGRIAEIRQIAIGTGMPGGRRRFDEHRRGLLSG